MSENNYEMRPPIQESVELEDSQGSSRLIINVLFKTCNSCFICGFFVYYLCKENHPEIVFQGLDYQAVMLLSLYCSFSLAQEICNQNKGIIRTADILMNVTFPTCVFISLFVWGLGHTG